MAGATPRTLLDDADWDQIEAFMSGDARGGPEPTPSDFVIAAMEALEVAVGDLPAVTSTVATNRLLDLWDAARAFGPEVARPAADLLTSLVSRQLVSADEVKVVCAQTRVALMSHSGPAPV
ncbi:MAG: hypothetical protein KGQ66_15300 [Acidobacteriota bacterium]|nr:hypothetical protein [Acidobacteriota bacterium]